MQKNLNSRIITATLVVTGIIVLYAAIFSWSMAVFENRVVTFPQALQVVVESLTTSGYGGFAPWESDFLNLFVLIMNLTGVLLVFIAFPVFFLPFLKGALEKSPPTNITKNNHVIICSYSTHAEVLIKELISRNQDYVIVESREDKAIDLLRSGMEVLLGDPEMESTLEAAGVNHAKAVVINSSTEKNISTLFSIRNIHGTVKIIAVLDDEQKEKYYDLAGAVTTISPRQLIGKSLADQVPAISIKNSVEIDNNFELIEIDIEEGSELCYQSVAEAQILDTYHLNIIGSWHDGEFKSPVPIDLILKPKLRLLVAGDRDELAKLNKKAEATFRHFAQKTVLIAGFGISGKAAFDELKTKSIDVKVIDIEDKEGVHIIGDIRQTKTLEDAGIKDTSAMIIAIQDDIMALFATLVARNINSKMHLIVRANNIGNVKKLYHAGADYVQSLATVSGRMLASNIFEEGTSLAAEKRINLVQLPGGSLSGTTAAKSNVRTETGCTILAVIRGGEKISDFKPETFQFREDDEVIMAGTDESIRKFEEIFIE